MWRAKGLDFYLSKDKSVPMHTYIHLYDDPLTLLSAWAFLLLSKQE